MSSSSGSERDIHPVKEEGTQVGDGDIDVDEEQVEEESQVDSLIFLLFIEDDEAALLSIDEE